MTNVFARRGNRVSRFLLLLALVLSLLGMGADPIRPAIDKVQPLLIAMVAQEPGSTVGVIVQKLSRDRSVETMVAQLGGVVTKDLHIINAFAAELPARAVPALAKAPGVRWVSLDAPVVEAGKGSACSSCVDTSDLENAYVRAIEADRLWNEAPYLQGQGVTVAIVDSGVAAADDFKETTSGGSKSRILKSVKFNSFTTTGNDDYGHGTHVAGIVAGNGRRSSGGRIGVAPKVNLVNVKVSDDRGAATASDVVSGLQWVNDNRATYNIRVVNLSLNSSVPESYHTSPLSAAVEILWFNKVVVVVSAGNNGTGNENGILYPPANDPFVITVGATDDRGTNETNDDVLARYSAYGTTNDGFAKPDLAAPGDDIVSVLASSSSALVQAHPDHRDGDYFRMSGTSMASAVVAGAVALLVQDEPNLTPDQVKYRLMATAQQFDRPGAGAGYLNIYAAVHGTTTESANTGIPASQLLWSGDEPLNWNSVNWNSVNWNSVNWNSVNWNSVNWNSVNWNSTYWEP